jgi:anthraniloyl-CoA monooxygenase
VALARPHLANPYFTLHAAAQYGVQIATDPPQYEPGRSQLFRIAAQATAELTELKLRTRPKPALLKAAE